MKKRKTFKGGYRFRNLEGTPEATIKEAQVPYEVIIPLRQGFGNEVPPIAEIGDKVRAGQVIGIDDASCSSPVHATVNGIVKDIRRLERFGHEMGVVVIESDGSSDWLETDSMLTDFTKCSSDEISKALYISGVASLGGSGFPTQYNTSLIRPDNVDSLVINAVKSEPFALSNTILLAGKIDSFINGVDILRRALPNHVEVYMGIDDREEEKTGKRENEKVREDIIREIGDTANWIHVHPLQCKYPQDNDVVLIRTILGHSISDAGAVVMDVQSALHAYEAVVKGKPVIDRIIALGGSALSENLFLKARVGTRLQDIIEALKTSDQNRYIYGGIMTGKTCDDLSIPVDRTAESIAILKENKSREFLSFLRPGINRDSFSYTFLSSFFPTARKKLDTNEKGERRPCIYCNYCENVCPVGLMPYLLSKYVTLDMQEEADRYGILSCIDCGLCTYVCPSKLPLMTHIQEGKARIREERREPAP